MPSLLGVQTCARSEEHTSELQSHSHLVCRLLLEKTKQKAALARVTVLEAGDLYRGSATAGMRLGVCVRGCARLFVFFLVSLSFFFFFFYLSGAPRVLPFFPTRRFSD